MLSVQCFFTLVAVVLAVVVVVSGAGQVCQLMCDQHTLFVLFQLSIVLLLMLMKLQTVLHSVLHSSSFYGSPQTYLEHTLAATVVASTEEAHTQCTCAFHKSV